MGFLVFSLLQRLHTVVFADEKKDFFSQNIDDLALYLASYDTRAASVLLSIERIQQGYDNPAFLETYQGDIENILHYVGNNPSIVAQL